MKDEFIIKLYFERDEEAILETKNKYGKYCTSVAYGILRSRDSAEECVDDAYLKTWQAIPPKRPKSLGAFVARLTRNISVNRLIFERREKRYSEGELVLDELAEVVSDAEGEHSLADTIALRDALNEFLASLPELARVIFVRRYWYMLSVKEIARSERITESNVKAILMRTRINLSKFLKDKELYL